jgi:hypothetical protein
MRRWVLAWIAMAWFLGCHTVPDPNDPARQQRIDDCLRQCPGGDPEPVNTAYTPAPSEKADSRTSCERRCHSIP